MPPCSFISFLTISTTDHYNHNLYLLLITFLDFFDAENYFEPISTFAVFFEIPYLVNVY